MGCADIILVLEAYFEDAFRIRVSVCDLSPVRGELCATPGTKEKPTLPLNVDF